MRVFTLLLLIFVSQAPRAQVLTPSLRDEVLSRVEMLERMGYEPARILVNVEMEITPAARAAIMAYGSSPEVAVAAFLKAELQLRRERESKAEAKRAHHAFVDCLSEDSLVDQYRLAVENFVTKSTGQFDATAAVQTLPVDTRALRSCFAFGQLARDAARKAGLTVVEAKYDFVMTDTVRALKRRDQDLDASFLGRTLGRTRDAALKAYYGIVPR